MVPLFGAPATSISNPRYKAPEVQGDTALDRPEHSRVADVYSLGVMMAEAIVAVTSQVRVRSSAGDSVAISFPQSHCSSLSENEILQFFISLSALAGGRLLFHVTDSNYLNFCHVCLILCFHLP
jgi:hypothetical protein